MKDILFWLGLISFVLTGVVSHLEKLPVLQAYSSYIELASTVAALVMAYLRIPRVEPPAPTAVAPTKEWPL